MERPFKIRRLGHFGLNLTHMELDLNGQPRPDRRPFAGRVDSWPESVTAVSGIYQGETFMGPWS